MEVNKQKKEMTVKATLDEVRDFAQFRYKLPHLTVNVYVQVIGNVVNSTLRDVNVISNKL